MLTPQENENREVKDLSGIWKFKLDRKSLGLVERWFESELVDPISMPVPCSYNDITPDTDVRDHIGDVWYEREFHIPRGWAGTRVCLRFGSVDHDATVWLNGQEVARHEGGFLPFEADLGEAANIGSLNRVTVRASNILSWDKLPSGYIKTYDDSNHPAGYKSQEYQFDFFNYAGINRPVLLTSTPRTYIKDIRINTDRSGADAIVAYRITSSQAVDPSCIRISIIDEERRAVAFGSGPDGTLTIRNARLWQPGAAYLYKAAVEILEPSGHPIDRYQQTFGVRTLKVTETQFLINDEPFYFQGCCKHEDMDVKGRGFDHAMLLKDFYLMRWIGSNSFRTSHYPYAEEVLDLADREGIVIIDEAPAVGMRSESPSQPTYSEERISSRTLAHHKKVMEELIRRDKNHPCVVMWSIANEPIVNEPAAGDYFREVAATTRKLDPSRPVTMVTGDVVKPEHCYPFEHIDVMCINRYHSWYSDPGHTELIEMQVVNELTPWHQHFRKPLIVSEYGADTVAGMHSLPAVMFSEEYQVEVLEAFHRGFDQLPFLIGEHVWNFADFATKQGVKRVMGNKKGVFTRQRQPKAAAFALRERWKKRNA